jgi:acetoacetyl-CoA synthetase
MYRFKELISSKYNVKLTDYESLRQWSINNLAQFWEEVWHFTGVRASESFAEVLEPPPFSLAEDHLD